MLNDSKYILLTGRVDSNSYRYISTRLFKNWFELKQLSYFLRSVWLYPEGFVETRSWCNRKKNIFTFWLPAIMSLKSWVFKSKTFKLPVRNRWCWTAKVKVTPRLLKSWMKSEQDQNLTTFTPSGFETILSRTCERLWSICRSLRSHV